MINSNHGKRGQVNAVFVGLTTAVLAFLVLVIAISLNGQILGTQQSLQFGAASSIAVVNETFTANGSLARSTTLTLAENIDNTTEVVWNETNVNSTAGDAILTRNTHYELNTLGTLNILHDVAGLGTAPNLNVSYNYTTIPSTVASNITESGLIGTGNVSSLIPTMGLIAGVFALLSLLAVLVFMFGPKIIGGGE